MSDFEHHAQPRHNSVAGLDNNNNNNNNDDDDDDDDDINDSKFDDCAVGARI